MSRDNAMFALIGLLAGFIAGYLLHEVMAARQPARLPAGTHAGASAGAPAPPPAAQPGAVGPQMEEVARLTRAIEADPEDAAAILALANLNYDISNWPRAKELYERYLALRPADPDVLTDLGVVLRALGDFDGAISRFDEAQAISAGHWQSLYNEVVVLAFDVRDLSAATAALESLERLQPDNEDVRRLAEAVARQAGNA